MIDEHHEKASEEGTRIIPSCGYDSIPSDMGVFYSVQQMGKPVKKVTVYHSGQGGVSGGQPKQCLLLDLFQKKKEILFF